MARLGRGRRSGAKLLRNPIVVVVTPVYRVHQPIVRKRRVTSRRPSNLVFVRPPVAAPVVVVVKRATVPVVHKRRPTARRLNNSILVRPIVESHRPVAPIVHNRRANPRRQKHSQILRARVVPPVVYVRPKLVVTKRRRRLNTHHQARILGSVRGVAGVIPPPPTNTNPKKYRIDTFAFY